MNQRTKIILGVVALILGAVAIGWIYFTLSPGAWEDFMAEMSGETSGARQESQPVVRQLFAHPGQIVPGECNDHHLASGSHNPGHFSHR